MQSFKYDLPPLSSRRQARRNRPLATLLVVVVVAGLGACAWNSTPRVIAAVTASWSDGSRPVTRPDAEAASLAFKRGEASLAAGAAADAAGCYDQALRLAPTRLEAFQRGLDARALGDLTPPSLATLLPDPTARMAFLLARANVEGTRRPAAALDDIEQALTLAPRDPRALRARAAQLEHAADWPAAIAAYEQALRILPDDKPLAAGLVALLYRTGELDRAAQQTVTLLLPAAGTSHEACVHVTLLLSAIEQGQTPAAIATQAHERAPQLTDAECNLFLARAYLQHYNENPNWHRESFARTLLAAQAVLRDKSSQSTVQAQAHEIVVEALESRSARLAERNMMAEARTMLDQALRLAPALAKNSPRLTQRFADLYTERAHLGPEGHVAENAMEAAVALVPDHAIRRELARSDANDGVSLLGARKLPQALPLLARAVALDPSAHGVLARYHEALVQTHAESPLAACAKASGISSHGALVAAVLEGYVRNRMPRAASQLYSTIAASLTPTERLAARAELQAGDGSASAAHALYEQVNAAEPSRASWQRLAALDRGLALHAHGTRRVEALERARHESLEALALGGDDHDRAEALAAAHLEVLEVGARDARTAGRVALAGLALDPRNPALGLAFAEALSRLGEQDTAIAVCRNAVTGVTGPADPAYARLRGELGTLYRTQKRFAEAIAEYKEALVPEAHAPAKLASELTYGLALAHVANGDRQEALNAIRQYVATLGHATAGATHIAEVQAIEADLKAKGGT